MANTIKIYVDEQKSDKYANRYHLVVAYKVTPKGETTEIYRSHCEYGGYDGQRTVHELRAAKALHPRKFKTATHYEIREWCRKHVNTFVRDNIGVRDFNRLTKEHTAALKSAAK